MTIRQTFTFINISPRKICSELTHDESESESLNILQLQPKVKISENVKFYPLCYSGSLIETKVDGFEMSYLHSAKLENSPVTHLILFELLIIRKRKSGLRA